MIRYLLHRRKSHFKRGVLVAGPNNPDAEGSASIGGSANWLFSIGSLNASDGDNASVTLANGGFSNFLLVTNFGFAIPTSATIQGIFVEIEKASSGAGGGSIQDYAVRLIKGGVIQVAESKLNASLWPSVKAYFAYGDDEDLWTNTWAPADLNADNFGVAIAAVEASGENIKNAIVDHVRITVYYLP